jgi:hypothetical protein
MSVVREALQVTHLGRLAEMLTLRKEESQQLS